MARETLYVTVANGTQVPFDEFSKWSEHKQRMMTDHPIRNVDWGVDHCHNMRRIVKEQYRYANPLSEDERKKLRPGKRAVMTPSGRFESIAAAAKYYGVGVRTIKTWIRSMRKDEFKYYDS